KFYAPESREPLRYNGAMSFGSLKWFFIAFNIVLFIVMGMLHQGQVVHSLLAISQQQHFPISHINAASGNNTAHIFYIETYMPPLYLAGLKKSQSMDIKGITTRPYFKNTYEVALKECKWPYICGQSLWTSNLSVCIHD